MKRINKKRFKFGWLYLILTALLACGCVDVSQTSSYDLTGVANQTSPVSLLQTVNTNLTFGWFGSLILMSTFAILVIAFIQKNNAAGKSIAAASFICFGLSIFLRAIELVPNKVIFITLIMSAISLAFLKVE